MCGGCEPANWGLLTKTLEISGSWVELGFSVAMEPGLSQTTAENPGGAYTRKLIFYWATVL